MVHQKGRLSILLFLYFTFVVYPRPQELSLRSAMLYVGLLISNAFGSVCSIPIQEVLVLTVVISLWLPEFWATCRGNSASLRGDGKSWTFFVVARLIRPHIRLFLIEVSQIPRTLMHH